ncbi:hypothetical protein MGG_17844 [Pyricularia oryzae 70-15]|uniref:Uncharacterized protein n=1 Tax=Pyricularia oryzae (strain 70-15 / ATCC MYA-4617 / FGSC 8958) TaxID=242507 RepID=G4NIM3_PYRO7|nr:uncharacterized protein MGG_17844 [Pyricularia oryzae 70-15]EHA48083.1 hypothetical protein MGG_17844 [Pyricularia oryzae 70-15]
MDRMTGRLDSCTTLHFLPRYLGQIVLACSLVCPRAVCLSLIWRFCQSRTYQSTTSPTPEAQASVSSKLGSQPARSFATCRLFFFFFFAGTCSFARFECNEMLCLPIIRVRAEMKLSISPRPLYLSAFCQP